jgi:hypothetical protein
MKTHVGIGDEIPNKKTEQSPPEAVADAEVSASHTCVSREIKTEEHS